MGLDTVELVMDFEDTFQISIPDEEASRMQIVQDTLDYIIRQLRFRRRPRSGGCPSRHTFHRLRHDLTSVFGTPRRSVRPGAALGDLVPAGPLRRLYPDFARANGLPVPPRAWFADRFPGPHTTVRDLVRHLAPTPYLNDAGEVDEQAVWSRVRQIISKQLGIRVEEIHPGLHYINDLNCD